MKKCFLIMSVMAIFALSAAAQKLKESQVPAAIKQAFQKAYPGTVATWEKEGSNYEVNFKQNGKSMSSVIDSKGSIMETETDIAVNELPETIQHYVKQYYKGAAIKEAARIVKADGAVNYEAEVNGKDVVFDADGKFIKEVKD